MRMAEGEYRQGAPTGGKPERCKWRQLFSMRFLWNVEMWKAVSLSSHDWTDPLLRDESSSPSLSQLAGRNAGDFCIHGGERNITLKPVD